MEKLTQIRGALPFFIALFLNAFVDLGHKIVIQNTLFKTFDGETQVLWTALLNALILLPFIFLFSPAGFASDKFPKNRVMQVAAWVAVALCTLINVFYHLGLFWPAFAMTLLFGMQSAFYGPAKLGYIKGLFGKENLPRANGTAQACSMIAILTGTFLFSILFESMFPTGELSQNQIVAAIAPVGWILMATSIFELVMVYRLPTLESTDKTKHFDTKKFFSGQLMRQNIQPLVDREVIRLSIFGMAMFWSIGQVMLAAFPAFAKETMGETNTVAIQGILAAAGIGIALGSFLAGRASKNHIETGLIPIGVTGIAIGLWLIPTLGSVATHALNYLFIGTMGGLFIVPLISLIQFHAGEKELGNIMAAKNWVENIAMLSFLGITIGASLIGLSSKTLLMFIATITVIGGAYTVYKLPQSLVRLILNYLLSSRYRIAVQGVRNIPSKGGVLLLGNHISWIDWAIIQIACPRNVHFVMLASIYERWYLKWILDLAGCIPIKQGSSSRQSLDQVAELLDKGKVVCLFPEGALSRTGHLGTFRHGYEKACENVNDEVVILPFYLRGLWGSQWSRSSDWVKKTRASGLQRDLIVAFGQPLSKDISADVLKRRVSDLSIESWQTYIDELPTLGDAWIESAKHNKSNFAIGEATGTPLSAKKLFAATAAFSGQIKKCSSEQNVGLLLPTSTGGVIANMASLLAGKTVVNLNYSASVDAMSSAIEQADIQTIYTSKLFISRLKQKGIDFSECFSKTEIIFLEELKTKISKFELIAHTAAIYLLPTFILKPLYCREHNPEATAAILFSSGSEGKPKGVMLSHRNIMANVKQISDVLNTEQSDVIMASLPLFHAFGLTVTQFLPLIEGLPMVCHPDPTDALGIAKSVARYRGTIMFGTSTFLRLFIRNNKVHPLMLQSLRLVVAGAEKLRDDVREQFNLKFHQALYEGYGATETTPVASVNLPDALDMNHWQVQQGGKLGTVGMALPGSSFKIVDPETWEELPTGTEGMILIGGSQVMKGYLNDVDKTEEVIRHIDGKRWYVTGDKGRLDADGFLTIVDRYSRFAKIGGEMVSLSRVEALVRSCIDEEDLEVVAISVPDTKKGERIILLADRELAQDQITQQLLSQGNSGLTLPSEWHRVDEVPKLGSGKTDFAKAKHLALELAS